MLNLRPAIWLSGLLLLGAGVLLGCAQEEVTQPAVEVSDTEAWKEGLDADVAAALAELPEEDRKAALEQRVCPVSGQPLGSMGKPIKVKVQEEDVFVCCEACIDKVKENPEQYLTVESREERGESRGERGV